MSDLEKKDNSEHIPSPAQEILSGSEEIQRTLQEATKRNPQFIESLEKRIGRPFDSNDSIHLHLALEHAKEVIKKNDTNIQKETGDFVKNTLMGAGLGAGTGLGIHAINSAGGGAIIESGIATLNTSLSELGATMKEGLGGLSLSLENLSLDQLPGVLMEIAKNNSDLFMDGLTGIAAGGSGAMGIMLGIKVLKIIKKKMETAKQQPQFAS